MLKKKERLNREAFNRFFAAGTRLHSPFLQIVYTPHEELHASVVVPKKIERLAVRRNKIRRRIYDILRRTLHGRRGGIYIVIVKPGVQSPSYEALKAEISNIITIHTK